MMKQHPPRKSRARIAAVVAGAAAVVAVAGAAVLIPANSSQEPAVTTDIAALAPANSGTLVLAPYSTSWWSKVAAMAPRELMLQDLTPPEDLNIDEVGYSSSPDPEQRDIAGTGPLRVFYIEAKDEDSAQRIAHWLGEASGNDHRNVHRNGRILAVTAVWVKDYPVPSQSMASVPSFKPSLSGKQAAMWFNPGQDVGALAGSPDSDSAKALRTYLEKGLGFSADAAWNGSSTDGNSWNGTFGAGNIDPARINFTEASAALTPQKVLSEFVGPTNGNTRTDYRIIDPGAGSFLASSVVRAEGQDGTLGAGGVPPAVQPVDHAKVTAMIDLNAWNRAATGDLAIQESVLTRAISANGSEMNLQLTYSPVS
ncbi:hypothetical protein Achl_4174 (plasmid) [Pseudarthrobacter chlorophenolicus A6]|uniref:Uncharacterized protein n=1 Tax=Pseudarthrobacter chlorophenolicus (strain ATCC 700700 / DSM 12829 / CIP 107037 / JCM 12360 / KCTC 9906 / NCIMB 13794 / A6) TaxID=452863 RepID=B8HI78_PSECP|nr:hypothetical protein [Pseudarthrobacter chlorophenolicus]ACL42125.1 hypothetical protein Achl_4174 [Pseudarthrobacter chlorophenolicus A6]SDQ13762.1 hypothetical protein SAMN04489738_0233 [Pseudarthrobacter chlorophenolicus]